MYYTIMLLLCSDSETITMRLLLRLLLLFLATSLHLLKPSTGTQQQPHYSSSSYSLLRLQLHRLTTTHPTPSQALSQDTTRLSSPIVSGASSGSGQYFVHLHLGSPPQLLRLVVDTGSDLIWTHCSPSTHHSSSSSFFPRLSSTFSPFHCYHPSCHLVPHPSPSPPCHRTPLHSPCLYHYSYSDSSSSSGFFSHDFATINSSSSDFGKDHHLIRLNALPFGCAFNISIGPGLSGAASHGVLGLGRGPISFPSHAASRFGHTFSYCLLDYTLSPPPTSFLLIGGESHIHHHHFHRHNKKNNNSTISDLKYTPLQSNPLSPTYYYIRITSVTIDGADLPIDPSVWAVDPRTGDGGTIVDTGTTLTFLPPAAYRRILSAMARRTPQASIVPGPPGFDLCVNSSSAEPPARMPRLVFRLLGGAELAPPARNYYIDAAEGVTCLAIQAVGATGARVGVIGNLMQQGFLMVFDRANSRLGFSRTGCGAY